MSMLLDALKKSEQQRRLGARPDIHRNDGDAGDGGPDGLRQWLPTGLVVVSVLIMAWNGWRQFEAPRAALEAPEVATRSEAAAGAASGDRSAASAGDRTARTAVETFEAPEAAASTGVLAGSRDPNEALIVRSGDAADERQDRQRALESFSQYTEQQAASGAGGEAESGTAIESEIGTAAEPTTERRVADQASAERPYEPQTMSYWELPQGVRDSLPEFNVTVLVYAEDPDDRFLLINGMRLKEKQELQSGVVLDEIRRDGAVFQARNYRFLVKG